MLVTPKAFVRHISIRAGGRCTHCQDEVKRVNMTSQGGKDCGCRRTGQPKLSTMLTGINRTELLDLLLQYVQIKARRVEKSVKGTKGP